jgi:hypothetical protein
LYGLGDCGLDLPPAGEALMVGRDTVASGRADRRPGRLDKSLHPGQVRVGVSLYQVQKLLFHVKRDRQGRIRFLDERTGGLSHWPAMPESGRIGIDFDRRFLDAFLGGRIETFLRYPRERLEAEAGPGGHEIRTWITVAGTAGDARGSLLVCQPVPAWSTGCAVAALQPR